MNTSISITDNQQSDTIDPDTLAQLCQVHHDMANYLNAIQGYVDLALRKAEPDTRVHHYLERLVDAAGAAIALHEHLGSVVVCERVSAGSIDLGELVRRGVGIAAPSLPANVRISVHIHERPAPLAGDALALQRLITNVVLNAGQAMPLGGALQVVVDGHQVIDLMRTRVRELHPGRYLRVTIRDTGTGMDQQTLAKMFERGFTTRETGSGLGLSAALETLDRHGGGIIVNSWPGTGTEVNLYLPWSE